MHKVLLNHYQHCSKNLLCEEDGATAIEYGLLAALIGATALTAQAALGSAVANMYTAAMGIIAGALGS